MMTEIGRQRLVEVPVPAIERDDDVLLRVRAAGVCGSDLHGYIGASGRRTPPLVMGHEATAEVVTTGRAVADLTPGTRVAIHPLEVLDTGRRLMGMDVQGAFADYVVWPAGRLFPLPDTLSFEAGALTEPLAVTVHAVNRAQITPHESAFVAGAGPIGLLTLAVLKERGVERVLVSDLSDDRLEIARRMGAQTVHPKNGDLTEAVAGFTDGRGVDVSFEAVGISATVQQSVAAVKDGGRVVWIGNNEKIVEVDMQAVVTRELTVLGTYGMTDDEFRRALELLATGHVPADQLINHQVTLAEGPALFDELLASPEIIKCIIEFA
ncbi:MAG: zinc-binding dehydrogenase [Trueperaceae bacterium]|nr:MAG: zinc-binding dehydrogenase [Trueperaceae bacterium]